MSIMSEMEGKMVDFFSEGVSSPSEVLSVYTRAQAIEDGVLIDVSQFAKEAGFKYPMAVTGRVFQEVIVPPDEVSSTQDDIGRLWDVLNVLRMEIKRAAPGQNRIDFHILVQNKPGKLQKQPLYSTCGPGDDLEPVLTVMMPDED